MTRRDSAAVAMIKQLPKSTLKKMNLLDLKSITGAVLIHDRIASFYDACYRHEAALRKFKVENGYCGGRTYCMHYTNDGSVCKSCSAEMRNPKRHNKHSEYGEMQVRQRREPLSDRIRRLSPLSSCIRSQWIRRAH